MFDCEQDAFIRTGNACGGHHLQANHSAEDEDSNDGWPNCRFTFMEHRAVTSSRATTDENRSTVS
ncbi:hypothetical protein PENVUL_c040G06697 [Penicillium vulpinum]|uniref:Uncharacterized protein n=1 Tax=Penicillium vulpinum TaxID=29845 RepID=A0A1V6RLJ5_9EURO|nr:hypothetical protein PENVUL_c040G06697 [Penicillium vulpinum]